MSVSVHYFTAGEVRQLVGISQRQLDYWDRSGLLRPQGRSPEGRGSRRLYTILDVVQLKAICRLRSAGVSLQRIRQAFDFLRDLSDEHVPLAELEVLSDGRAILIRRSDDLLMDPLTGQFILRFPLSDLLAEIRTEVGPVSPDRDPKKSFLLPIGNGRRGEAYE